MEIDHIIFFSNDQGNEAEELTSFGLIEGSNRIHPGQGTRNRKFYFENFFLEIVWAFDKREITSALTAPTRLWERTNHRKNGCSPFGLCLSNSGDSDDLFQGCLKYRPSYLPEESSFEIITNEEHPYLPWICRLPLEPNAPNKGKREEPTDHEVGIRKLTKIKFGIYQKHYRNRFTDLLTDRLGIVFENTERYSLNLEFDHRPRGHIKKFNEIPLTIEY